jgi:hypothetical protein
MKTTYFFELSALDTALPVSRAVKVQVKVREISLQNDVWCPQGLRNRRLSPGIIINQMFLYFLM